MNDLDAMWVHDTQPLLNAHGSADIIAQRGAAPGWLGRKGLAQKRPQYIGEWGSTICMGFAYFASTPATRAFVKAANIVTKDVHDDQVWVNDGLKDVGIDWLNSPLKDGSGKITPFGGQPTYMGHAVVDELKLKVALLAPQYALRVCEKKSWRCPEELPIFVEHCQVSRHKLHRQKTHKIEETQLWYVKPLKHWPTPFPEYTRGKDLAIGDSTAVFAWQHVIREVQSKRRCDLHQPIALDKLDAFLHRNLDAESKAGYFSSWAHSVYTSHYSEKMIEETPQLQLSPPSSKEAYAAQASVLGKSLDQELALLEQTAEGDLRRLDQALQHRRGWGEHQRTRVQ
jgi:hypothetical protein